MNQALFSYIAASPTAFQAVAHTALLLSTALTLLDSKGAELFIDDPPGDDCEKD